MKKGIPVYAKLRYGLLYPALALLILLPACNDSSNNIGGGVGPKTASLCSIAFKPLGPTNSNFGAAPQAAATPAPVRLSSCPIDANRDVAIGSGGCGPDVFVDQSFVGASAFGTITINGSGILYFPDNQPLMVSTSGILVNSGGALRIGTPVCPTGNHAITDRVEVIFTGNPPQPTIPKGITVMGGGELSMFGEKGTPHNQYAADISWSYLAEPAGPAIAGAKVASSGANTIMVAGRLDWQPDDWIVVAPTDFTADGGEFVQIMTVSPYDAVHKVTSITLVQPLKSYHFGGPAPDNALDDPNCKDSDGTLLPASFCETATQNYGVDERAEVGLVTRSIRLTSAQTELPFWHPATAYQANDIIQGQALTGGAAPETTYRFQATTVNGPSGANPPSFPGTLNATVTDGGVTWTNIGSVDLHWGGEITVADGAIFQMEGVEIENFGKDRSGSYPISITGKTTTPTDHWLDGDLAFNTIHHSYNHGIAIGTSGGAANHPDGLKIAGNVIARTVGHLYDLTDGTASAITFDHNLGVGAMEYQFSTCSASNQPLVSSGLCGLTAAQLAARLDQFWIGDNLAIQNGYDGYNIPFTDPATGVYAQAPVSGFYITNISAILKENSIAGCQGNGNGVLYLPATPLQTGPVGTFLNNRLHGCYVGLDASYGLSGGYSGNLNNIQPKDSSGLDQLTTFDGLTATRNRYFGTWMRPNYFVVNNSRFATNRESISLVSGGGPESSPAGEWGLLENSVLVGESQNNPSRWGPCPVTTTQTPPGPWGNDGLHGCAGDDYGGRGYPQPYWNEYGYMYYDGPARLETVRMVNFVQDIAGIGTTGDQIKACASAQNIPGELTGDDAKFLCDYSKTASMPGSNADNSTAKSTDYFVYEGDAAFGWFQSNVNNYPPTQYSEHMTFENVDLRHQVYTQEVNQGPFVDGDKGTVIQDRDGSLTGYCVMDSSGQMIAGKSAISLNNLPFLGTPNSVDECQATGPQDQVFEARASSLISPQDYATLEVNALTPPIKEGGSYTNLNQFYFTKDQKDYVGVQQYDVDYLGGPLMNQQQLIPCAPDHSCISLKGRNSTGAYEPKVINGLGYTMQSNAGFPGFMDLGFVDAEAANGISSTNPFRIRLGICYKTASGTAPADASAFTVMLGRKSWSNTGGTLPLMSPFFYMQLPTCQGLDNFNLSNLATCPAAPASGPVQTLTPVDVTSGNPLPAVLDPTKFYYDATNGLLFVQVQQTEANAIGASPLGNPGCSGSTSAPCLNTAEGETLYSCPADGCPLYTIEAKSGYAPNGPTTCTPYGGATDYSQAYPANMNQLGYESGGHKGQSVQPFVMQDAGASFETKFPMPATQQFPHNVDTNSNGDCTFK
ncbi:MAG TPA: G8 domain-containing protein [Candidatus Binataceae bacterium]|nr:G8 domain-containing protein [Candidatus Binataceae bacterium]